MFQFLSRYGLYLLGGFLLLIAAHFYVLHLAGFTDAISFTDAIVTGSLLAGCCFGLITISQFYFPSNKRLPYLLALIAVFDLIWLLLDKNLLPVFIEDVAFRQLLKATLVLRFMTGYCFIGSAALITVLLNHYKEQKDTAGRNAETRELAKEAELFNLRQQLQPHFLFNSLNSINALIGIDPPQAREMVHQLSLFLRGTLHKDVQRLISLKEEADHISLYLDIEKLRFGHRLSTVFDLSEEALGLKLPPLLLQPVVENAIKFALYGTIDDVVITVTAIKKGHDLQITVTNTFDTDTAPASGTGFGLRFIYRWLYLLFARTDLLQTYAEGNTFTTILIIPQHDTSHPD